MLVDLIHANMFLLYRSFRKMQKSGIRAWNMRGAAPCRRWPGGAAWGETPVALPACRVRLSASRTRQAGTQRGFVSGARRRRCTVFPAMHECRDGLPALPGDCPWRVGGCGGRRGTGCKPVPRKTTANRANQAAHQQGLENGEQHHDRQRNDRRGRRPGMLTRSACVPPLFRHFETEYQNLPDFVRPSSAV